MRADRPKRKPQYRPATPLPPGTRTGGYEVRNVLGTGTYGIVYRVYDAEADEELAVREYLPTHLAVRDGPSAVVLRSPEDAEHFELGLRFFVNEGKLLGGVDHPSIVHAYRAWQDNGTAYMALSLCQGRNLRDTLQARWKPPNERALRATLDKLLGALELLHAGGVQHRDIAPQNVMIEPDGRPVLLDLDSPRRVASARGATGPQGPRDGYAPLEVYGNTTELKRGPWTDFYALGATLHFMISGKPPPPALSRADGDRAGLQLLRPDARHSLDFLGVVDWMLALQPADRPQSVQAVRDALAGKGLPERHAPKGREKLAVGLRRRKRWLWIAAAAVVLLGAGLGARQVMKADFPPWIKPSN
jgi:serine/threonine protein kinase